MVSGVVPDAMKSTISCSADIVMLILFSSYTFCNSETLSREPTNFASTLKLLCTPFPSSKSIPMVCATAVPDFFKIQHPNYGYTRSNPFYLQCGLFASHLIAHIPSS